MVVDVVGGRLWVAVGYCPIRGIVRKHGMMFHVFAKDSQIYFSFDSNTPELVMFRVRGMC